MKAQHRAVRRLAGLYPPTGPWTSAALWHEVGAPSTAPTTPIADEFPTIHQYRLAGLVLRFARDAKYALPGPDRAALQRSAFEWAELSLRAATSAGPVVRRLRECGIDVAVSKGPGIARWYPSPACRPYSDIDLLVSPRDFDRAVGELERDGWREAVRNLQPWPYFRRHCREGINLESVAGGSVDIHHTAPPWIWAKHLDFAAMTARSDYVDVSGVTLPCLDAADNLLIAALHVVSDRNEPGKSLMVWRDVATLARVADSAEVRNRALTSGLAGWLAVVLDSLPQNVIVDPSIQSLRAALPDVPVAHPRRLAALLSPRTARQGLVASQSLRIPPVNAVVFVLGMAVPSLGFLRAKFPGQQGLYREWWGGWLRSARQRAR